ncbi:hypothetical protein [Streptomyces sp. NPDC008092]|uniref:hypothetical protein n=1 Tax=Streptomyces sp. NPDC008092 TaxID=3364808 RepID=UPI0036E5EF32
MAYPAPSDQQQKLERLDGGRFAVPLDSAAGGGQLTVGRFSVAKGEAPPYHGGIVHPPENVPHGHRIASDTAGLYGQIILGPPR